MKLVYTPPEYRQKGYATTTVAELSQKSLDMGYQFCCLYTDLKNSLSYEIRFIFLSYPSQSMSINTH